MATYLKLVLAMTFYGVSFVSTKIVLASLGPLTLLACRLALSAVFLWILDAAVPGGSDAPRRRWPCTRDLGSLALVTLFQPLLYFLAENNGLRLVSASVASIVIATIPVFTPLFAWPLLGERLHRRGVAGLVFSVAGVVIIVAERRLSSQYTPLGLLLVFGAVLAAVGYSVAVKKVPIRYRPLTIAKVQSLMALPVMLVLAWAVEGTPAEIPPRAALLHLAYLGLFPSSLAFVFLSAGIRALGANRAMVFTNLIPGITAVFAWALLGETYTVQKVVGMAVVIGGVLIAQSSDRAEP